MSRKQQEENIYLTSSVSIIGLAHPVVPIIRTVTKCSSSQRHLSLNSRADWNCWWFSRPLILGGICLRIPKVQVASFPINKTSPRFWKSRVFWCISRPRNCFSGSHFAKKHYWNYPTIKQINIRNLADKSSHKKDIHKDNLRILALLTPEIEETRFKNNFHWHYSGFLYASLLVIKPTQNMYGCGMGITFWSKG